MRKRLARKRLAWCARKCRRLIWRTVALAVAAPSVLAPVMLDTSDALAAQPDCRDPAFHWSEGQPPINLRHVFCGEVRNGQPKGFHSMQLRSSTSHVAGISGRREQRNGIYSAIVTFSNGQRKLSTFFPDHCTVSQLLKSIEYAARNPRFEHRAWGWVGSSAPAPDAEMFCLDNHRQAFEIRFGVLANGRVNTAFPN